MTATEATPGSACGIVALVGRANVGKSTLLNALLGEKVSIVSPVAQTTRTRIRGILTEPRGQLVFLDTPGVHRAAHDLGRVMNRVARASIEGVDVVLLVLDGSSPPREEDVGWVQRLARETIPFLMVLNQSDRPRQAHQEYRDAWAKLAAERTATPPEWFIVSAQTGAGLSGLTDRLFRLVPVGPLLFPPDVLTDYPRKLNMADVIREKFFHVLKEELPHVLAVEIEDVNEGEDHWEARGTVFVQKSSQKGIVLGNKGRLLKKVLREAEKDLAEMYGRPVALDVWVKVDPHWSRNFWMLKRLGYVE